MSKLFISIFLTILSINLYAQTSVIKADAALIHAKDETPQENLNLFQVEGDAAKSLYNQMIDVEAIKSNTGVCEEWRGKVYSLAKVGKNYTCIISPTECQTTSQYVCIMQLSAYEGSSLPIQCSPYIN